MTDHLLIYESVNGSPHCNQEKMKVMGWDPEKMDCADLSVREMGLAIGNAWALPVSTRLVEALNKCMGWQPDAVAV